MYRVDIKRNLYLDKENKIKIMLFIFFFFVISSFLHMLSHIVNYVDCFGANGSGLANYDDMPFTTRKSAENYKYQAIDDLVNRLQVISLPGHDKVTFIMNRIS